MAKATTKPPCTRYSLTASGVILTTAGKFWSRQRSTRHVMSPKVWPPCGLMPPGAILMLPPLRWLSALNTPVQAILATDLHPFSGRVNRLDISIKREAFRLNPVLISQRHFQRERQPSAQMVYGPI